MGCLQFSIRPRNAPRLDRCKAETSGVVCGNASVTRKACLGRFFLRIIRMSIFALRICLPNFEEPVGHGLTIAVENTARNSPPFTRTANSRQIAPIKPGEADAEKRANGLPRCGL